MTSSLKRSRFGHGALVSGCGLRSGLSVQIRHLSVMVLGPMEYHSRRFRGGFSSRLQIVTRRTQSAGTDSVLHHQCASFSCVFFADPAFSGLPYSLRSEVAFAAFSPRSPNQVSTLDGPSPRCNLVSSNVIVSYRIPFSWSRSSQEPVVALVEPTSWRQFLSMV